MRPHGRAQISQSHPRALAVCDRCGFLFNQDDLQWQWDWKQGPRLFNLRILVCRTCLDVPQESGRTIVLPPDPVPIANARPENYALADNPVSPLGFNPAGVFTPTSSLGGTTGNLIHNGGLESAFSWNGQSSAVNSTSVTGLFAPQTKPLVNKRFATCAALAVSISSFQNTIGKNWNGNPATPTPASTVAAITHVVSGFAAYAPSDQPFLRTGPTGYQFQGSSDGAPWTTLASGTTAGTAGETLTATTSIATAYQFHQFVLQGDGISNVGVAGLSIAISDAAPNDI